MYLWGDGNFTTSYSAIFNSVPPFFWASHVAQLVKNQPAMWETWVWSLGWEDPLEKGKATHSSMGSLENSMDCIVHGVTKSWTQLRKFHTHTHTHTHTPFIFNDYMQLYSIIYMYHIFIHSSVDRHLDCFQALAIINSATMNIGVHVSFWITVFPGVRLLGHMVVLCIVFKELPYYSL